MQACAHSFSRPRGTRPGASASYAPALNPVENTWEYLRKNDFTVCVGGEIIGKSAELGISLPTTKSVVNSIKARKCAQVKSLMPSSRH